jgi:PX domain-containing protein kinase-like protein
MSAPPPPKPPAAPKAPPPPAAGRKEPGRGALLGSIEGFKKGGLKKTVTVDKSAPVLS